MELWISIYTLPSQMPLTVANTDFPVLLTIVPNGFPARIRQKMSVSKIMEEDDLLLTRGPRVCAPSSFTRNRTAAHRLASRLRLFVLEDSTYIRFTSI